jgi:hypothetical protein
MLSDEHRVTDAPKTKVAEDRWAALRASRRAQGLCQRCAQKWHKDHRCAEKAPVTCIGRVMGGFHAGM